MVSDNTSELIEDLRILVVPGLTEARASMDISDAVTVDEVQDKLRSYFLTKDASASVKLMAADAPVGVVTRESFLLSGGTLAESPASARMGAGGGLELPGVSTRYGLLRFTCSECDPQYRVYYDERNWPACEHGKMTFEGLCRDT
jgi:hypothetical protein